MWAFESCVRVCRIKASPHNDTIPTQAGKAAWHIGQNDLRDYIRRYPEDLTGHNIDVGQLVNVLVGVKYDVPSTEAM